MFKNKKVLILTPHLSTGGCPQYLFEFLKNYMSEFKDFLVVEHSNFSDDYVIQKNKIKSLIGTEKLITLGNFGEPEPIFTLKRKRLIDILESFQPEIVWMNEFPEAYDYQLPPDIVMEYLYREKRNYKIVETTHYNAFNFEQKRFLPDEFMFCSPIHMERSETIDIPKFVWEVPIEKKERPNRNKTLVNLGLDPNMLHILNVGLFHDNKNQKYIFDLAKKYLNKKIQFHFIGNTCFLNDCGIGENLYLSNCKIWGERSDVDVFMSCMDIYLFPSKKELNPLTVKEALSWSMDVVVNRDENYVDQYVGLDNFYLLDQIVIEDFISKKIKIHIKKIDVVVTYFNEDLSWIDDLDKFYVNNIYIYNKSGSDDFIPLENIGLDSQTILNHIVKHYNNLPDGLIFLQGNPFDTGLKPYDVNDLNQWLIELQDLDHTTNYTLSPLDGSLENGKISYWKRSLKSTGYDIKTWMKKYFNISKETKVGPIYWGCQFGVHKEVIESVPLSLYEELLLQHDSKFGEISHFMERVWGMMFKIDGKQLHSRNNFGEFLNHHKLTKIGVEVGTFKGEFAKQILSTWEGILYMVDPWRELTKGYIDISNHINHPTSYLETINNLKGFEDRGFMLRGKSSQIVDLFEDESLDFVYIDGNHEYSYVKEDIDLWYPKIKKGGLISGHDYCLFNGNREGWYKDPNFAEDGINKHIWGDNIYYGLFGVNPAVDEFVNSKGYQLYHTDEWSSTWYIFKK